MRTRDFTRILTGLCLAWSAGAPAIAGAQNVRLQVVPAAPGLSALGAAVSPTVTAPGGPSMSLLAAPSLIPAPAAPAPAAKPSMPARVAAVASAVSAITGALRPESSSAAAKDAGKNVEAALTGEAAVPVSGVVAAVSEASDEVQIAEMSRRAARMEEQYAKVVIGQKEMGRAMRLALFAGGHVLAEGLPGTAKTRSIKTLARMTGLSSSRIQFTRDLQPFDITGQEEKNRRTDEWEIRKGPIFANIVLADEINRAKSQAQGALLQPMEEGQVSISGKTLGVPQPFMVLATQNPIEDDGTYPLPRAQLDRFMFKVKAPYLGAGEISQMLDVVMNEDQTPIPIEQVLSEADVVKIRELVRRIKVSAEIRDYIERLLLATRPDKSGLASVREHVRYGASDRSAVTLMKAARAQAFEQGRAAVLPEDVQAVAHWVLDHRVILTYEGEEKTSSAAIVAEALKTVPAVKSKR